MIYAVIDTNVLVSALLSLNPYSATVLVVNAISKTGICPLYNYEIITEYKDVLSRAKFNFPAQAVESIINKILEIGTNANRVYSPEIFQDADDVVFYEVALSKEDAFLVTGNTKHFPKNPIVVTPAEMLEILKQLET